VREMRVLASIRHHAQNPLRASPTLTQVHPSNYNQDDSTND
jgi:hypothetical protein